MSNNNIDQNAKESHNSTLDISITNENYIPPEGSGMPRSDLDRERPPEYTPAGSMGVQIPEEANIPHIDNAPAFEQPLDLGAGAGAGTSTPIQVSSEQNKKNIEAAEMQTILNTPVTQVCSCMQ